MNKLLINMETGAEINESLKDIKDVNFYIIPGSMSPKIQDWQVDFKNSLIQLGASEEKIHLEHLTNPKKLITYFGPYKEWRESSHLPVNPDEALNTVIIGHSSGAELALVWAEHHKNAGLILFSPYEDTKVGPPGANYLERFSGMFSKRDRQTKVVDREFNWERIHKNSKFVIIIHPEKDNLVSSKQSFNVFRKIKGNNATNNCIFINSKSGNHYPTKDHFSEILIKGNLLNLLR